MAHIIATKTANELISDDDMKVPSLNSTVSSFETTERSQVVGHQERGRTIGIHSLAVLPEYQKKGLGTILLKEYIQRMVEAETADRISILTYERLLLWYEKTFGFRSMGKSTASFGGGDWVNMVSVLIVDIATFC